MTPRASSSVIDIEYIQSLHNIHWRDRGYILGNGPSLLNHDLSKLSMDGIVFGCNDIRLLFDKLRTHYWVINDACYLKAYEQEILQEPVLKLINILGMVENGTIFHDPSIIFFFSNYHSPLEFRGDIANWGVSQSPTTVYVMLELAWYMGIRDFHLYGVDGTLPQSGHGEHFDERYLWKLPEPTYRDTHYIRECMDKAEDFITKAGGKFTLVR